MRECRGCDGGLGRILQATRPIEFEAAGIRLAPTPPVRDLRATGKIKPVGNGGFETMGMVLRWQDPGTMLIVRVDGTPGRVSLERVQGGQRSLQAGYVAPLRRGRWNIIRVAAQDDRLNLFLNGKFLGGVREDDPVPGRVGLMAGMTATGGQESTISISDCAWSSC